jgi:Phage integrase, N-terminal SAM-like domain
MTVEKAMSILNELKNNQRQRTGPITLQEKRELEQVRKENEQIKAEQFEKESITFSSLFEIYLKQQQADGKKSWKEEQRLFKSWIQPVIGELRLLDIAPIFIHAAIHSLHGWLPMVRTYSQYVPPSRGSVGDSKSQIMTVDNNVLH